MLEGTHSVASASERRAKCWVSPSATAKSRVACKMERPSVHTSTTSPATTPAACCRRRLPFRHQPPPLGLQTRGAVAGPARRKMANTKIPASAINTAAMGTLTVTTNAMAIGLAQNEESRLRGREARSRRGLGTVTDLLLRKAQAVRELTATLFFDARRAYTVMRFIGFAFKTGRRCDAFTVTSLCASS
jgi:hypothetical protein